MQAPGKSQDQKFPKCILTKCFSFQEIPNFLSDEECDHIIHLAQNTGLISSVARGGLQSLEEFTIPDIRSKNTVELMSVTNVI